MSITSTDIFTARNGVRDVNMVPRKTCANLGCQCDFTPKSALNIYCDEGCAIQVETTRRADAMRLLKFMEINAPGALAKIRAAMRSAI